MSLEKSLPIAESMVDAEENGKSPGEERTCLNCGTPLTDIYCARCGQKSIARRQKLGDLLVNFLSSFWSFESKFLRTGKYLLFRPGKLAIDYNAGKRERYYHPARLYVFVSFIFFLLASMLPDKEDKKEMVRYTNQDADDFSMEVFDSTVGKYKTLEQYDSAQQALPADQRDKFLMRKLREREIDINSRYKGRGKQFSQDFYGSFTANLSKALFFLLPFFALLLKLLYVRRDFYYSEHLVFSIYYYNFFFLAGIVYMLIEQVPYGDSISWIIVVWMFVYLLLAMRYMYRQKWWKTILKYGTFMFLFWFLVLVALIINLAVSILIL